MPGTLRLSALIDRLDNLLDELSTLWCDLKNYEHLTHVEAISEKIEAIIRTLKTLE
jgi:hypothetical protein